MQTPRSHAVGHFIRRLQVLRCWPSFLALAIALACSPKEPADFLDAMASPDGYVVNCQFVLRHAVSSRLANEPVSSEHLLGKDGARHVVSITYHDSTEPERPALGQMSCEYPADPFWWHSLLYGDADPPPWPCMAGDLWPDVVIANGVEYRHDDDGVGKANIEEWVSIAGNHMSPTGRAFIECGPPQPAKKGGT